MNVRFMGPLLVAMLLTSLTTAQSVPSQVASPLAAGTFRLTVTEREASLDAHEASLAAILAEIGQRTRIPIVTIHPRGDERITIHLSLMPLDKALKQLTPDVAIVAAQGPNAPPHRIAKVYLLPKGQPGSTQLEYSRISPEIPVATDARESATSSEAEESIRFKFTFDPSQH
jgi:hypothetical protein